MSSAGFWSMGGYARYVWPCFSFAAFVVVWNLWTARAFLAAARQRALRSQAMDASAAPAARVLP